MYVRGDSELISDSEDVEDEMPELEDATDDGRVEYPTRGESLVTHRALSTQAVVEDDMVQQRDNIFHTRCLV